MSQPRPEVVSRLFGTLGGVVWLGAFPALWSFLQRDSLDTAAWAVFVLSCLLLIVGLLGLHARQAQRMLLLGPAGLFVSVLALVLLPVATFFFYIVALILALGSALYGIATIRAGVLHQPAAWLLTLGALPLLVVGVVNILGGSVADPLEQWALLGFAAAFGVGVIWLAWGPPGRGTNGRGGVPDEEPPLVDDSLQREAGWRG